MAKLLLFGANGQVGRELSRSLLPVGDVYAVRRGQCDLTDKDAIMRTVREVRPDVIVNAAAYTAVDRAESEEDVAMAINGKAPGVLAQMAKEAGSLLVDYSTDYVFDGEKKLPYVETDRPCPLNVYGRSKLAGLQAIEQSGCRYLVFRVSWVYGRIGKNFVNTMLRLAGEKPELKVVADQWGSPTPADLIADITAHALMMKRSEREEGLFNLAPRGETNWHEYAAFIYQVYRQLTQKKIPEVIPVTSAEYPVAASRPKNSRMNTHKIQEVFGITLPDWRTPLQRIIEDTILS